MKRILYFLLCALLALSCLCPTISASALYINDEAGILTSTDKTVLENKASSFKSIHGFDIAVLFIDRLPYNNNDPFDYAGDYFEDKYGKDGIILLVSIYDREWAISCGGSAKKTYTDKAQIILENSIMPYLRNDGFYEAAKAFIETSNDIANGVYKNELQKEKNGDILKKVSICTVISLVGAFALIMIEKSKMKTARRQNYAYDSISEKLTLRDSRDIFLFSRTRKTRRETSSGSSGSSGSHSRSGGGRTGRSGKF